MLAVVGYHAAPSYMRGGFVGVDVFFVISGFLISTIILRERDDGDFSLVGFYARRARRLFPALVIVLAVTWLLGWYYLLPHEFEALGKHMTAGAGYFINFTLKRESGYFDVATDAKPLLHLWSLAVEEQFYIVWPLLLLFVRSRRTLVAVIAALAVASFVGSIYALGKNQASAFYLPQYRMWELGAGALLAVAVLYRPPLTGRKADLASFAGLGFVLSASLLLAERANYPGFFALLPVAGALLLIAAGPRAVVNRALLAHPALVFIGLISYPLYLWHWPLLSFAHILGVSTDVTVVSAAVLASVTLAVATYFLVERPIRHMRATAAAPALVTVTVMIAVVGALAHYGALMPRLNAAAYRDVSVASSDWAFPDGLTRDKAIDGLKLYRAGRGANAVLFVGDSNAEQYWPRVSHLAASRPIVFATLGGCPPIPGVTAPDRPDCHTFTDHIKVLAQDPQIGTIVISAAWLRYFDSAIYQVAGVGPTTRSTPGWDESFERLGNAIRDFTGGGKQVWLVLSMPVGDSLAPGSSLQRSLTGDARIMPLSVDRRSAGATWEPIHAKLREVATRAGARVIDPLPWFCDAETCRGRTADNAIIYMDAGHLRASYVREHATFIDEVFGVVTGSVK